MLQVELSGQLVEFRYFVNLLCKVWFNSPLLLAHWFMKIAPFHCICLDHFCTIKSKTQEMKPVCSLLGPWYRISAALACKNTPVHITVGGGGVKVFNQRSEIVSKVEEADHVSDASCSRRPWKDADLHLWWLSYISTSWKGYNHCYITAGWSPTEAALSFHFIGFTTTLSSSRLTRGPDSS